MPPACLLGGRSKIRHVQACRWQACAAVKAEGVLQAVKCTKSGRIRMRVKWWSGVYIYTAHRCRRSVVVVGRGKYVHAGNSKMGQVRCGSEEQKGRRWGYVKGEACEGRRKKRGVWGRDRERHACGRKQKVKKQRQEEGRRT